MKAPVSLAKLPLCIGAFLLFMANSLQAQQPKTKYHALSIHAGGMFSLNSMQEQFAATSSLQDISQLTGLLGGSIIDSSATLGLGAGHGFELGLNYAHNLNADFSWQLGFGYQQRILNVYSDYVKSSSRKQQAPYASAEFLMIPVRNGSNRLIVSVGLQANYSSIDTEPLISRSDSIGNVPFLGTLNQTTKVSWEQSTNLHLFGTASLRWMSVLSDRFALHIACRYQYAMVNQFRFAGSSVTENPLFPITIPANSADYKVNALSVTLGLSCRLGAKGSWTRTTEGLN